MTLQSPSWPYTPQKYDPIGYMHPNVHCSAVYSSQDMEAHGGLCIFQVTVFVLFGQIPRGLTASHILVIFLLFEENSKLSSIVARPIYISSKNA